jgi:hypothetical protein
VTKYATQPAPVESEALDTLQQAQASLRELVSRLHRAMDAIAEEAGAYRCSYCGEWKTRTVTPTPATSSGESEGEYCPRCAPATAGCPF